VFSHERSETSGESAREVMVVMKVRPGREMIPLRAVNSDIVVNSARVVISLLVPLCCHTSFFSSYFLSLSLPPHLVCSSAGRLIPLWCLLHSADVSQEEHEHVVHSGFVLQWDGREVPLGELPPQYDQQRCSADS
jgi:hypothetical protein